MELLLLLISGLISIALLVFSGRMIYDSALRKKKTWFWFMFIFSTFIVTNGMAVFIPILPIIYYFLEYRKKKRRKR